MEIQQHLLRCSSEVTVLIAGAMPTLLAAWRSRRTDCPQRPLSTSAEWGPRPISSWASSHRRGANYCARARCRRYKASPLPCMPTEPAVNRHPAAARRQILEYSKFSGEMNSRPVVLDSDAFGLYSVLSDLIDMCASRSNPAASALA